MSSKAKQIRQNYKTYGSTPAPPIYFDKLFAVFYNPKKVKKYPRVFRKKFFCKFSKVKIKNVKSKKTKSRKVEKF